MSKFGLRLNGPVPLIWTLSFSNIWEKGIYHIYLQYLTYFCWFGIDTYKRSHPNAESCSDLSQWLGEMHIQLAETLC